MKTLIFLDDERNIQDVSWVNYAQFGFSNDTQLIVCRNFQEFKHVVDNQSKLSDCFISFDHDLQDFHPLNNIKSGDVENIYGIVNKYGANPNDLELTGYSCLRYLGNLLLQEQLDYDVNQILIHTQNSIAKKQMEHYVNHF